MQRFKDDHYYPTNDPGLNALIGTQGSLAVMRCKGRGPKYHKVGNRVLYLGKDLNDYLDAGRIEPRQPEAA